MSIHHQLLAGALGALLLVATQPAGGAEQNADPKAATGVVQGSGVELTISVILGSTPTKFRFMLKNNGEEAFETTPIATNDNVILIDAPDGRKVRHTFAKKRIPPVSIAPGKSHHWDVDLMSILDFEECKAPGDYVITWSVDDIKSEPYVIHRE